jgi:predicted acylesterase/phospholipase RssA
VLGQGGAFDSTVAAVARRLGSKAVGVVLSGGGARGFAHIGVLEELVEAGTVIDRVGGCSMGAFVGAMFAMGLPIPAIRRRCIEELVERKPMADYTVPVVSLIRGQRGEAMLRRTFREARIEELPRDYFCISCDLITGRLVVHRRGPVFEAVGPSMSLPGVFPPVSMDGRLLVDGGVLDNLPVEPMADTMEGPVIAVDVTAEFRLPSRDTAPQNLRARWSSRARRRVARDDSPLPGLRETLVRSIAIGSVDAVAAARGRADLLIAPETGTVGLLEFGAIDRMIDAGRQAASEALAQAPALTNR